MYPDTAANVPAISGKDWFKVGRNVQPILMSMVNKQPKIVNDIANVKYKQNEQQQHNNNNNNHHQHQQQQQQLIKNTNEPPATIERKFEKIVDSNYNLNIKSNMNGLKHKDNDNKLHSCDNNNSRKFAFLAQQTIPDYRSQQVG